MAATNYSLVKNFNDQGVPQVKISFETGLLTTHLEGYYESDKEVNKLANYVITSFMQNKLISAISTDLFNEINRCYIEANAES